MIDIVKAGFGLPVAPITPKAPVTPDPVEPNVAPAMESGAPVTGASGSVPDEIRSGSSPEAAADRAVAAFVPRYDGRHPDGDARSGVARRA